MDDPLKPQARAGLLRDPWRLVRFGLVGGVSTVIYAVFAWIFTVQIGMPAVIGSILAYCLAAIFSYTAHRRVTFRSNRPIAEEASRFAGISFAGWIVAIISPLILTNAWGLPPLVAIVFASVAVPIMSFIGLDRFVFRPR
jgi:putative flippase GtrA